MGSSLSLQTCLIRTGIPVAELRRHRVDAFSHFIYCAIEVSGASFNDEGFDAKLWSKALCLQPSLRVIRRQHLFGEGPVACSNVDGRVPFVTNHRCPGNVLCFEPHCFSRGDPPDSAQCVQRQLFFITETDHHELLCGN